MNNEASNPATNIQAGRDIDLEIHGDFVGRDKITYGLSVEEVTALVIELKTAEQPTVWDGRIPYLGLSAFQESDAEFFFGRENLVNDLLGRLQQSHFITIAGPSGSGKSSVARAGLFHALRRGRLPKSDQWLLATMLPGNHPLESLAVAIERLTKVAGSADSLRHKGLENPHALHQQVEILLTDDPSQRLVLLVDQFEEVFTQTKNEAEQAAFIQLLTHSAHSTQTGGNRLTILLSLRSDFISHCARYPALRELLNQQFMLVGGMEAHDLAKAITLPALEVGAEIDPALVSRIMADMKGEPGVLPLMSFALRDLFEAEKTAVGKPMDLTLPEYVQRGGIEKALERHANAVFADFSAEQQALARGVFSKLIEVGQGRVDTRRTAVFSELIPAGQDATAVSQVVDTLARAGGAADDE
ncbi:MAG: ATP-binding protein, partial [Chloroflexi bacterium]|nr:ATP-binding protein [Chloroflexota bacterium]